LKQPTEIRPVWESADCHLCGPTGSSQLFTTTVSGAAGVRSVSLVRCKTCGLVFLNPRPTEAAIESFYEEDYAPHRAVSEAGAMTESLQRSAFRVDASAPARFLTTPLRWFLNTLGTRPLLHGRRGDRLIDVGCASGRHLLLYHRLGWDVLGLEADAGCCGLIRDELRLPVLEGSWSEAHIEPGQHNAVMFWHVLEHLHDPRAALEKAFRALKPGGVIQIAAPTCDGAGFSTFGEHWAALEVPKHLYFFSGVVLRKLLEEAGFIDVRVRPLWRESLIVWKRSAEKERAETGAGPSSFALVPLFRKGPDVLLAEAVRPSS
jgi:2-polyprenyl-3-methyl-5-hydroxy-6-metoxy-1,4-benzoquinol methylase